MMNEKLRSWREVMKPRLEVQQGKFRSADFAADLMQSVLGNAADDYSRPERFFRMTYITDGMRGLMMDALRRVTGGDGAAVIQVKTAFGGGKTHSMLALYHLMNGGFNARSIPAVSGMLDELGLSALPRVNIAVIGGTFEGASTSRVVGGIETHTLWGNIAAQLGGYEYVRASDVDKKAPGYDALQRMFDDCGPCLVLIDELAAYGSKLYTGKGRKPSDESFSNFKTFIQELTEAAKYSKNSLVVAAMPDSQLEAGDEDGIRVMEILDHIFERMEAVWKPVTALEGFKIVRRRLFDVEGIDDAAVEGTASAFSRMYQGNAADFPAESREVGYKDRIVECYPIHPEIFDRLYGEWSTLENFQRTRGVLQFLAEVVHDLWESGDTSPLIMAGAVRYAGKKASRITNSLPGHESWSAIIDQEIDGLESLPRKLDGHYKRENDAAMRLARTILLGSAPSSKAQNVRGVEKGKVYLGTVIAGENISVFRDAMNNLKDTLSYLYVGEQGLRYWFDTRPTLRRTVKNRAAQRTDEEVESEIRARLKQSGAGQFGDVYVWPESDEVPDAKSVRLVILSPVGGESEAEEILKFCGKAPRMYRNTLLFVMAAYGKLEELNDTVRTYLGWKSVDEDHETLNLTRSQILEARSRVAEYSRKVDEAVCGTWSVVLVPKCLDGRNIDAVTWKKEKAAANGTLTERVFYALSGDDLSREMTGEPLRMELDNLLWKDSDDIEIKTLWENLCTYCYLPRVLNFGVLSSAIKAGMSEGKYFALASGKSGGKYEGLRLDAPVIVDMSNLLVRREAAEKQIESERQKVLIPEPKHEVERESVPVSESEPAAAKVYHSFFMSTEIQDRNDPAKFAAKVYEDIVKNLLDVSGAKITVKITVDMTTFDGVSADDEIVKSVEGNCKHMNIDVYNFTE